LNGASVEGGREKPNDEGKAQEVRMAAGRGKRQEESSWKKGGEKPPATCERRDQQQERCRRQIKGQKPQGRYHLWYLTPVYLSLSKEPVL
jgi:hypothetical protein